jgi:hypothetical protein
MAGKAMHASCALLAEEVVNLAALAVIYITRRSANCTNSRGPVGDSRLTTGEAASKTPYGIPDPDARHILAFGNDKASVLVADGHAVLWRLFGSMAPEQHLQE